MKTILIVDPAFSGQGAADPLELRGYSTFVVSEARTALSIVRSGMPVDLVISEITLPDMDGIEFLNELKRDRPWIPALVVTSCDSIESYLHAVNLGVIEYLNKPVMVRELFHIVQNALDHQGYSDASRDAG